MVGPKGGKLAAKGPRLYEDGARRPKKPADVRRMIEVNSFLAFKVADEQTSVSLDDPAWLLPLDSDENWSLLGRIIVRAHELGGSRLAEVTAARELASQFFADG